MRCLIAVLFLALCAGCSTPKPQVDWSSRVGVFTYDEAVREMGPPDRESKLTDNSRVAEWHVGDRKGMSLSFGLGSYSQHSGVGVGQEIGTVGARHEYLRLSFDQDGRLKSTSRVSR